MSQCRMSVFGIRECRFLAATARPMLIQETLDEPFVDGFDINMALGEPVSKMRQSGKVVIDGIGCIVAIKQMQHECINVGCQCAIQ